ncbi:MAG TPA: PA2169 family four-helix-bundle protein [Saprospiraceae bacterium]|nr:PA2169 family four-helix-bundle protein [Saprospiraceae bacterium]HNG88786.1 PA2169 family four-helix-bundle protein [Saprospiraceae bacterium]
MNHESHIETINDLIEINNDRIAGYQRALEEVKTTRGPQVVQQFQKYINDSQQYVNDLSNHVQQMGGTPVTGTTLGGKIHRLWMDIKNEFAIDTKESALESTVFGDGAAIKAYELALNVEDMDHSLPDHVRATLTKQLEAIRQVRATNEVKEDVAEEVEA